MKKIKAFLFSSTPFFLCLAMQVIAVYYVLFIAGIFLFGISPAFLGKSYSLDEFLALTSNTNFNAVASMIYSGFCIVLFVIWLKKNFNMNFKVNVKEAFHPYEILGIALLVPGTQFLSGIVTGILAMIFPSWMDDYMALLENAGLTGDIPLLMIIYSVCLAPISEELAFRGVTMNIIKKAFPFWLANIIQALFFGVFHLNPLQGCYTFVVGLFMGYICEKGGTIYHAILFHFLFNLWGTTSSKWLAVEDVTVQGIITIVGTIVGLVGGMYFLKKGIAQKMPVPENETIQADEAVQEIVNTNLEHE